MRVVENEIIEVDEFAFEPKARAGVGKVSPANPALPNWAFGEPLVEPGQRVLGGRHRSGEGAPRHWIGELVAGLQVFDRLDGNPYTEQNLFLLSKP